MKPCVKPYVTRGGEGGGFVLRPLFRPDCLYSLTAYTLYPPDFLFVLPLVICLLNLEGDPPPDHIWRAQKPDHFLDL